MGTGLVSSWARIFGLVPAGGKNRFDSTPSFCSSSTLILDDANLPGRQFFSSFIIDIFISTSLEDQSSPVFHTTALIIASAESLSTLDGYNWEIDFYCPNIPHDLASSKSRPSSTLVPQDDFLCMKSIKFVVDVIFYLFFFIFLFFFFFSIFLTLHLFRCVLASLYEGLSVRMSVRPWVRMSVSIKEKPPKDASYCPPGLVNIRNSLICCSKITGDRRTDTTSYRDA